jgi:hypothetical protein
MPSSTAPKEYKKDDEEGEDTGDGNANDLATGE